MYKKLLFPSLLTFLTVLAFPLKANTPSVSNLEEETPLSYSKNSPSPLPSTNSQTCTPKEFSEALGHLIGKNLELLGLPLDFTALVKGMEDAAAGKSSPLSEDACVEAITAFQEKKLLEKGEKNLLEADSFLEQNLNKEGVVSLENGQLQYKVIKEGKGTAVQAYNSPLVRCTGHFLNGENFQSGSELEFISLDETIAGFSKGIVGMREGEIRTLYIHPKLGYGKQQHLNPNALLIFEVELIKADASSEAHAASNQELLPFLQDLDIFSPIFP